MHPVTIPADHQPVRASSMRSLQLPIRKPHTFSCCKVLHSIADVPLVCHALNMVLERGWGPIVVVVNEQNKSFVKEASLSL